MISSPKGINEIASGETRRYESKNDPVPERDAFVDARTTMAQTLTALYFHVIFSTKNRVDLIRPVVEDELYAYIGGILNNHHSKLLIGNGDQKHAHLLLSLNKMVLIPDIIGDVKRSSSKWLKTKGGMLTKFGWQDGYAIFSLSPDAVPGVANYIKNQAEHHRKKSR